MPASPEQIAFVSRLKKWPGEVKAMDERRLNQYLRDAPALRDCHFLFWTDGPAQYMIAYRNDRLPLNGEVFPIMELIFGNGLDAEIQIHEVGQTAFSREFVYNSYTESTVVDKIADMMEATADHDSYSDAFEFGRTDAGKLMLKAQGEHEEA